MVRVIGEKPVLKNATVLQEVIVETVDPEDASHRWIWLVQLLEGTYQSQGAVVLRAQAKKIARRFELRNKTSLYFEERDDQFHLDLNAIELSIDPAAHKAKLAARYDLIVHPRGSGLGLPLPHI